MTATELLSRFPTVKKSGDGWIAKCPAHDDKNPSLSINDSSDRVLLHCHAGCTPEAVVASLGVKTADLFHDAKPPQRQIVATYDYRDASGKTLFQVLRYEPKGFSQQQPDGTGRVKGIEKVLYRLPEITTSIHRGLPIFICEGEKDVLAMVQRGFSATCKSGGTGNKWQDSYSETLRGADVVIVADKDEPGRKDAAIIQGKLKGIAKSVRTIELPAIGGKPVKDAYDFFAAGGDASLIQDILDAPQADKNEALIGKLTARRFNIHARPPEIKPRFFIGSTPISTAGNLTAINAGIKSGKSSIISAMLASTTVPVTGDADCLGFFSRNPDGHAVIHMDTEQSIEDHFALIERALRRASLSEPPAWLQSFCLTGFSVPDLTLSLDVLAERAAKEFGGIHSILIDGVADMVNDVNDPAECNAFVAKLHALAIQYACSIVGVIHFNPGTEKTRGHLGSQLERKAETNLRLDKDGDAIVVWSEKNRRAPITKATGPRFTWSDDQKMHVSIASAGVAQEEAKRAELLMEAEAAFEHTGKTQLSWTETILAIRESARLKEGGARKHFNAMIQLGVIRQNVIKKYELAA